MDYVSRSLVYSSACSLKGWEGQNVYVLPRPSVQGLPENILWAPYHCDVVRAGRADDNVSEVRQAGQSWNPDHRAVSLKTCL